VKIEYLGKEEAIKCWFGHAKIFYLLEEDEMDNK
jgi:hypothetical protein